MTNTQIALLLLALAFITSAVLMLGFCLAEARRAAKSDTTLQETIRAGFCYPSAERRCKKCGHAESEPPIR